MLYGISMYAVHLDCIVDRTRSFSEREGAMIKIDGRWLVDAEGRTLILRGVNLGASSKVPATPDGATHLREGFFDHRRVSFVGRPFPLAEADEHFARLRHWGLTTLRFLVTWEAIEHAGPGVYDEAYLDYVEKVMRKAGEHGLQLFIDPHQDVWSRFSGGDGAPGWTFEAVGLDIRSFQETGAAIVHQTHGDPFPRMIWPTNASKLAAATMFTLFFGGEDFAPATTIDGESVQAYLQRHYINAVKQIAERLKGMPHVIGYDTMNEPSEGYIGWVDLRGTGGLLRMGATPSPFQSMLLGAGIPQLIPIYRMGYFGAKQVGEELVNAKGVRAWLEGQHDLWRQNGVWDIDSDGEPQLLRPHHFSSVRGREVDFSRDYYRPFANRFAREIRSVDPDALIFIETAPMSTPPLWGSEDAERIVYAPHWYDGYVLFMKDYKSFLAVDSYTGDLVLGAGRIRRSFSVQLARFLEGAAQQLGEAPTLIGEFGIAFDMGDKRAYKTGDFRKQVRAMDRSFCAIEDNLLNCTLWNYTADNTNARGDQWNDEDLSIFSRDQQDDASDIDSGGRALEAVVRPYATRIAGRPLKMTFDYRRGGFEFTFEHNPEVAAPTEIFVPNLQYPTGINVSITDGRYDLDAEAQVLCYWHSSEMPAHTIRLTRK
jgi:hypothetical protein